MTRKLFASVLLAGAVLGGAFWLTSTPETSSSLLPAAAIAEETTADAPAAETEAKPVEVVEMVMGSADAPVTMVEYASFTCPHCKNFHTGPLKEIKKNYIDTGKVRLIFREAYFDRPGLWASMIARCGGPLRYFGIVDLIYENQSDWAHKKDPVEMVTDLRKFGKIAGLNDEQLDVCMSDAATAQALVDWYQANDAKDSITGTPTFIINGEKFPNNTYEEFAVKLDEAVAAAK
ncbi:DsbA family protein [Donghicola sp. C2-DW-16]|uniref:DsbA family protein n=1 Tax=Donghicola mangrovi TaxID=2729614 RepID=A0ABX2P9W3_9RHOB|nr:DsbA family protein [Donghicola mangrovi]NVO26258.1 DsbA family protein [Donghicola mangrovi]